MGPLQGVKIIELAGIGPAPFAAMLLADLGATVIRIDRPVPARLGIERPLEFNLLLRNRQNLSIDLKSEAGRELVLELVQKADGLIEGFRPGVTERLGLGPDPCLACNPRLVYGRMTGWGQEGPLAQAAGHDLNYIAVTGVLSWIGRCAQEPVPPLNLLGDFAGGGLYLALGMLAAMLECRTSGRGQVVDAAIVDGTASLATSAFGMHAAGLLGARGTNILDGGAPFYDVYRCKDDKYICVASIEPKFYAELCKLLGHSSEEIGLQQDRQAWDTSKEKLRQIFESRTRNEWCALLEGTDACFSPVMEPDEAASHPHLKARQTFVEVAGVTQPAPAPRFSRSAPDEPKPPEAPSERSSLDALRNWLGEDGANRWSGQIARTGV
ncbi:Crotonobetainyl-CoA:carnitine CoA-transferase CaiB [Variovorax sp. HW608]|uniref:CaiB/BaiF CoA transferase family protein n=1 Tax=Variovorax sp. HW608 TaxID=1034889 RepID=UPI00081FEF05|nr:CaiB/BaiF CoA-transferase family protein [Variovorax sp. HW608]SCK26079.1 Crotonobetainyl-CoA:carnitine CoA-transferase CaiB [Variovorax sp. HW608]